MSKPYTYIISHKPSGVKYYGVQYGKKAHPNNLGVTYFSSSKFLKKLIEEEGIDNFEFSVRKIFTDKKSAVTWERKFLERIDAKSSPMWFNKYNGTGAINPGGYKFDEVTRTRMRKPKSSEHRAKLAEHLKSVRSNKWSEERRQNYSDNHSGENHPTFGLKRPELTERNKARRGKTREELYGKEKAIEMARSCGIQKGTKFPSVTCPHCHKSGAGSNMKRYHFDNCKSLLSQ